MSLLQYKISNTSAASKTFSYYVATVYNTIVVAGNSSVTIIADDTPSPALIPVGTSEDAFLSGSFTPASGEALLWSDGNKVKHIKISNTPLTGSSINSLIGQTQWVEFSMVGAKNKDNNFLYPTSTTTPQPERFNINGASNLSTYSLLDINQNTSSPAITANTASADTGFSFFDKQFLVPLNCSPLANNIVEQRTNEWLQDVDYSVNALTPINFAQLIEFEAVRASVPQSNYTKLGFVSSRYVGSSTTRDNINEYNPNGATDPINKPILSDQSPILINKGKGPSLGKIPNVELNNAYIAYFNKIIDPYPLLNNKTAYYIKYLIDDSGNILDPGLSNINYSIFTETFKLKDYDGESTRVNTSIQNIDESKELTKLTTGLASIYKVGKYPVPILYSQTSSIGHTSKIALSGSKFYSALGIGTDFLNLGVNIYATQSVNQATVALSPQSYPLDTLEWAAGDIVPFESNTDPTTIPTSSIAPTNTILFPLDNSNKLPISERNTPGANLSDNYNVEGNFTFTTSTMPAKYLGGDSTKNYLKFYLKRENIGATRLFTFNLYPFYKPPTLGNLISNYSNNTTGFNISNNGVKLTITVDPGGANQKIYGPFVIERDPLGAYGRQWEITPTSLRLTINSLYLEDLIISNTQIGGVFNENARRGALPLIAGGWKDNLGFGGVPVKYDWSIDFTYDPSIIKQGTGLYFRAEGSLAAQDGSKNLITRPKDVFLFFGAGGVPNNNWQWARTFSPTYASSVSTDPILKLKITSDNSDNVTFNTANGPFWRRLSGSADIMYMSSSILNQSYGKSYIQAKLQYTSSFNTDFPLTIEPDFIEFDPVTDFWSIQEGDEIRFENNEEFTYTVVNIEEPKNAFSNLPENKLQVTITPPFEYAGSNGIIEIKQPINFDFFVVRRWKENKNFIILNQQKPYGIPVSQSSSPGILFPEHRVEIFNVNPDLILKDLIEKRII